MWYSILIAVLAAYLLGNLNGAVCMSTLLAGEASLLGPELQLKFETQSVLHRKKG